MKRCARCDWPFEAHDGSDDRACHMYEAPAPLPLRALVSALERVLDRFDGRGDK